jgi:hypothetical protein
MTRIPGGRDAPASFIRRLLAQVLSRAGLLDAARSWRRRRAREADPEILKRERERAEAFPAFRDRYGSALAGPPAQPSGSRVALLLGRGILEVELALIKTLQIAGVDPVVMLRDDQRALRPYYELAGVRRFHTWSEFSTSPAVFDREAGRALDGCRGLQDVVALTRGAVRIGRITASTAIRDLRVGTLPLDDAAMRRKLVARLSASLAATVQAERILAAIRPNLAIFWDTEYTPKGEVFDVCLAAGVDVVAYGAAHSTNGLMFKRHTVDTRDHHLASLSDDTWTYLRGLPWTAERRERLDEELIGSYAKGEWFRKAWTQANTRVAPPDEVRAFLGLDPRKPTAILFPNILSDTPLMWARPLFPTYEDWLIDTVQTAMRNDRVNWVVKIHPANIGRRIKDRFHGAPPEMVTIERRLGALPAHMRIIPPDVPLTTTSFFGVMDYCVTVRGTVGIEAARLGIPVLTAAESRYSHRGFTVDSSSMDEFLQRVETIDRTPPMASAQKELAERFAYGTFVLRPLVMESVTWDYGVIGANPRGRIHLASAKDWARAPDLSAWARWVLDSRDEDLIARGSVNDEALAARS